MSDQSAEIRVCFQPGGEEVVVQRGVNLLAAARQAGITLRADCDGKGQCGKCRLVVRDGQVSTNVSIHLDDADVEGDVVLACRTKPLTDLSIFVPEADIAADIHRLSKLCGGADRPKGLDPLVRKLCVTLEPTTIAEAASDRQRLDAALAEHLDGGPVVVDLAALQKLGPAARADVGRVTATLAWSADQWHLTDIAAGHEADGQPVQVAAAVDVGTSTVVVHLVDVNSGRTLDTEARFNSQAAYGADYITRIMALEQTTTLEQMQTLIVGDINALIAELTERQGLQPADVLAVVAAGNTPMTHFLLGLDPTLIRKEPYVSVCDAPAPVPAAAVGLEVAPQALLYPMPGVAAFVGGDITAGVLDTGLNQRAGMTLLIDVGTNGEIVLGNADWMACASSSAGIAFEGTRFGMRGVLGAIERIHADDAGVLQLSVIGDVKPRGICGSGVLDLIAELFRIGVLKRDGKFETEHPCPSLRRGEDEWEFVVAGPDQADQGRAIYMTQSEINNIIRSKAGVAAAITILLNLFEVGSADLEAVQIAGSFGNFIDIGHAVRIGLLPEVPLDKVRYVGNTSLGGAKRVLCSRAALKQIRELAGAMTYVDLMTNPGYMDEFVQANFLPHTDATRYPGVMAEQELAATNT